MSNHHKPALPLVLDWDGTVTERDSLHMIIERFGEPDAYDALEEELGRSLTLDEVIARVLEPLEGVVAWMRRHVRVRPGLPELVEQHDPLIVSAGFHETIQPILEREGVRARVVANHVRAEPTGWRSTFADGPTCKVCGERCKRGAVASLGPFAYAGDGVSDRCISLLAERRFARDGLAAWLDAQGIGYERFADLHDLVRALADGPRA